jgi:enhancing lycopene biosynthesis protein 2
MKKIAVILSGCGHRDGSEITETVSLILALSECQAQVEFFAPHLMVDAVNHLSGGIVLGDQRNTLVESARITRGKSQDLSKLDPTHFDALIFVGGAGVVKNLSNWSNHGPECIVIPAVKKAIEHFYSLSKPIGAICIAPFLLARVLGEHHISLTIGNDTETINEILKTGAKHVECKVNDIVVDKKHKIVTTPAYMFEAPAHEIFKGIASLAKEIVSMI